MSPLNPEEQAWETIAERYDVNWGRVSKVTDEDLEKLSDIKENLEQLMVAPLSAREQESVVEETMSMINKLIGEWSE